MSVRGVRVLELVEGRGDHRIDGLGTTFTSSFHLLVPPECILLPLYPEHTLVHPCTSGVT